MVPTLLSEARRGIVIVALEQAGVLSLIELCQVVFESGVHRARCPKNLQCYMASLLKLMVADKVLSRTTSSYKTPGPCRGEDHWIETPAYELRGN